MRKEFVTSSNIAQSRSSVKASYDCILEDLDFAEQYAPVENKNIYVMNYSSLDSEKIELIVEKLKQCI